MRERRVLSKQEFFNASETQNQSVRDQVFLYKMLVKVLDNIIIYLTFLISTDCFIKKLLLNL